MSIDVDSGGRFWPPNRNSPDENRALSRHREIEDLLAATDRTLVNLGRSDEAPTGFVIGNVFFQLLAEKESEFICAAMPGVRASSLWFIIAVYLEARQESRRWYELSDDDAQHIMRVLSLDQRPNKDEPLSRRALVLAYLLDHSGWAPSWFRPLPEA